jgi:hypothetical protein
VDAVRPVHTRKAVRTHPANAVLVSAHEQLAARWGDITANPFT